MATEEEEHVRSIYKSRGGDSEVLDANAEDLNNAVQILSEQLYSKPTHFLLELVQNADDNIYDEGVVPELHLTLGREFDGTEYLRIDCNERGFTKANVNAICKIKQSTKARKDGYIGEKGIGFKSVFRVASEVFIASKGFSFKFDKKRSLGMIKPIWSPFPKAHRVDNLTQLYLKLENNPGDSGKIFDTIEKELAKIDGRLLVFLRKIKSIHVKIQGQGVKSPWMRTLRCSKQDAYNGEAVQLQTEVKRANRRDKSLEEELLVVRHTATGLTPATDRANVDSSEIVLAFPVIAGQPFIDDSSLYAFLPVKSYGFSFLIQADFLLTANRGSIDEGKRWNEELRNSIPAAFQKAIDRFLETDLRYSWPKYLPPQRMTTAKFFNTTTKSIFADTAARPVLESLDGTTEEPKGMRIVPSEFRVSNGLQPFFAMPKYLRRYLSDSYDVTDVGLLSKLKDLGVEVMTFMRFFPELESYIADFQDVYKSQPSSWHSSLAHLFMSNTQHWTTRVVNTLLIPLRDSSWTTQAASKEKEKVFFQSADPHLHIPPGLSYKIVDTGASRDKQRRKFLAKLDIEPLDSDRVVKRILYLHSRGEVPKNVSDLIKQTIFMFRAPQNSKERVDLSKLKIKSSTGELCSGNELYMDSNEVTTPKMSSMFEGAPEFAVKMIDPAYVESPDAEDWRAWHRWLQSQLKVAVVPRWIRDGGASPEIVWLFNNKPREFFNIYRTNREGCTSSLRKTISEWRMKSRNKQDLLPLPLKSMFLPTPDLVIRHADGQDMLHYLDIECSDPKPWTCLAELGITVKRNLQFWLEHLKVCRKSMPNREILENVYEGIQGHAFTNPQLVKDTLNHEELILVPTQPGSTKWMKLQNCRWNAPACFVLRPSLANLYPNQSDLFYKRLGVKDWVPSDILDELSSVSTTRDRFTPPDLVRLKQLLAEFSKMTLHISWNPAFENLHVFPRETPFGLCRFGDLIIPDKKEIKKAFGTQLPWLDLNADEIKTFEPLFRSFHAQRSGSMYLSDKKRLKQQTEPQGEITRNRQYEESLKSKMLYVCSLVKGDAKTRVKNSFNALKVYGAERITLRREAKHPNGTWIRGRDDIGSVVMKVEENCLYLLSASLRSGGNVPTNDVARNLCQAYGMPELSKIDSMATILQYDDDRSIRLKLEGFGYDVPEVKAPVLQIHANGNTAPLRRVPEDEAECISLALPPTLQEPVVRQTLISKKAESQDHIQAVSGVGETQQAENVKRKLQRSQKNAVLTIEQEEESSAFLQRMTETYQARGLTPREEFRGDSPAGTAASRLRASGRDPRGHNHTVVSGGVIQHGRVTKAQPKNFTPSNSGLKIAAVRPVFAGRYNPSCSTQSHSEVLPLSFQDGDDPDYLRGEVKTLFRHDEQKQVDNEVGFEGEHLINGFLESRILEWSHENWTSHLRTCAGFPEFAEDESNYADFTFQDEDGAWTRFLLDDAGVEQAHDWLDSPPQYHVEVKTTTGPCSNTFFMSDHEWRMAEKYEIKLDKGIPKDVYMIARIYYVGTEDQEVEFYVDPAKMKRQHQLRYKSYEVQMKV